MGTPAVFLRLGGCNLKCVWCDTTEVWRRGKSVKVDDIASQIAQKWGDKLRLGAHLVITGGEPLIKPYHQPLIEFLQTLTDLIETAIFVEVETNATVAPSPALDALIAHYNCSPKLRNSGMPEHLRITPDFLFFAYSPKATFKFVVSCYEDIAEILNDFVTPYTLNPNRIYLMPCADNLSTLTELAPQVAEWAKQFGFRYSDRLQLRLWDRTTGV